jgi:hypothetical protein
VKIVGPDGTIISPDQRGIFECPFDWLGKSVSIRETNTWKELNRVRIPDIVGDMPTITIN